MVFPDLPVFNVPVYERKKLPNDEIYKWMQENMQNMKKSGQIKRIRQQESRQPVDVQFVLYEK